MKITGTVSIAWLATTAVMARGAAQIRYAADGVTGEYTPPEGYFVAEREPEDFERFDAQFPKKEKKKLPGQLV